jgi:hypothetical protein
VPWFREFAGIDTDRVDDERSEPAERPGDGDKGGRDPVVLCVLISCNCVYATVCGDAPPVLAARGWWGS